MILTLTRKSGVTVTFEPKGAKTTVMMRVERRRMVDGYVRIDCEFIDRDIARTMWSQSMKRGGTRVAGWPVELDNEDHDAR